MPNELNLNWEGDALSLKMLMLNLAIGIILSIILRWHFRTFGSTLTNRSEFAQVFPFILLTTLLIITIVKSSLALSLGLVGALSIVRFRTPIKEPEELAYLFVAIAMGLGLGANQTLATVVGGVSILAAMAGLRWTQREVENKNLFLSITYDVGSGEQTEDYFQRLNEIIARNVLKCDLRKFDLHQQTVDATYLLDVSDIAHLTKITDELRREYSKIGITFLDQNQMPSA